MIFIIQSNTFDLRKIIKRALVLKRQPLLFFVLFARGVCTCFSPKIGIKFVCDLIEMRLDMVLVRSKLVKTLNHAHWCVSSGFVFVNGSAIRVHSHPLNVGDLIRLNCKAKELFNSVVFNLTPDYLEVNYQCVVRSSC